MVSFAEGSEENTTVYLSTFHTLDSLYRDKFRLGFPCGSAGEESTRNAGDPGSIPELGRSLDEGRATHSSILAWRIPWTSPWVAKSWTRLSDFHFKFIAL